MSLSLSMYVCIYVYIYTYIYIYLYISFSFFIFACGRCCPSMGLTNGRVRHCTQALYCTIDVFYVVVLNRALYVYIYKLID